MKLKYFIQQLEGQVRRYENPMSTCKIIDDFWAKAPAGRYTVEIKRIPKEKTHKQVKTIFGLLINTAILEANEKGIDTSEFVKLLTDDSMPNGVPLTKDFLKELLYICCPIFDEQGHRITLSKASTKQANKFFEDCQNLLSSRDIYIPDPNPNYKENKNG